MKVLMISPSNILFMPYVSNYLEIFRQYKIEVDLICWDRLGIEDISDKKFIYKDNKLGHKRSLIDYWNFTRFIRSILKKQQYDKIIVFGIQLTFFLKKDLRKKRGQYIIDIRDYHKLIRFMDFSNIVKNAYRVVISSPAYKHWLPFLNNYTIHHNVNHKGLYEAISKKSLICEYTIVIGYIGSVAHIEQNKMLINSLGNNMKYLLTYNGQGIGNEQINNHIQELSIKNVVINGKYYKEQEPDLYDKIHFVNLLLDTNDLNNKTCMANRFYNAVIFGRPLIMFEGSYMAKIAQEYHLGLVVNSLEKLDDEIEKYIQNFSVDHFNAGRHEFYNKFTEDNKKFREMLMQFTED